jgi:hypothetical protein
VKGIQLAQLLIPAGQHLLQQIVQDLVAAMGMLQEAIEIEGL